MGSTAAESTGQADALAADVTQLETLGQGVIASMQSLRELLATRTTALEECRGAFEESRVQLGQENQDLSKREHELCEHYESRDADLSARESRCVELEAKLAEQARLIEGQPTELKRQQGKLEARIEQAEAFEKELDKREAVIAEREKRVAATAEDLKQQSAALGEEHRRIAAIESKDSEISAQLDARRAKLDAEQEFLATRESSLAQEQEELRLRVEQAEVREAELQCLSSALDQRRAEFDQQEAQLRLAQQEYEANVRELQSAQDNLTTLHRQLETELNELAKQKSDLLQRYGLSEGGARVGASADAQLPKPAETKARDSLERFQKLCRDAKRKALSSG